MVPDIDPFRNMELLTTSAYICVTYGYYLRCYEGFWVDCQRLIYEIYIRNYDRRYPHVIVSAMGSFKGEYKYLVHLLPLINVTQSVIRVCA